MEGIDGQVIFLILFVVIGAIKWILEKIKGPEEPHDISDTLEDLYEDFREEIRDGAIQDVLVDSDMDDINGDPIMVPDPIPSPLSATGANARPAFFTLFAANGAHPGWLNDAELKLISEWLDMGAQYWNDPFQAPEN